MCKKYISVLPKDLERNLEFYIKAAKEGRVLLDVAPVETNREVVSKKVRAYVERIRGKVCRSFRSSIDQIWDDIFADDELMAILMPNNKTRKCRDFNKNGVFRILGVLINHKVYEELNERTYSHILEETSEDTSYRSYIGRGLDSRTALASIRRIVSKHKV